MQPALGQDRKLGLTTPTLPPTGPLWPLLSSVFKAQCESYLTNISSIIKSTAIIVISDGVKYFWPPGGHRAWP